MKGLLFTYAMTVSGSVGSFFNPFFGLLVYVCFATANPQSIWYWSVPLGNYSRLIAISLLIGWAIHGFGDYSFGRSRRIVWALIGFWCWALLGAWQAPQEELAWQFVTDLGKIVLPVVVGATLFNSVQRLKQFAWVLVLSQGFVAYEMNLSYFQGFNRMQVVGYSGMDSNSAAIAMVTGFGLAIFMGIAAQRLWQKTLALGAAVLMAHSVMFAFSRGGMLGLIAIGVVVFVFVVRQPWHLVLVAAVVLLMLRLAGPEVRTRFFSAFVEKEQRDQSASSRVEQWGYCWDAMKKHPMFGVGPNHWMRASAEYRQGASMEAHSLWFQTGAELGIPGGLLLMSFYALCIWQMVPLAYRAPPTNSWADYELKYLACGVVASLVGFAVSACFVSLEGLELPYNMALLGAGISKVAAQSAGWLHQREPHWYEPELAHSYS